MLAMIILAGLPSLAVATTIRASTWERLIDEADFVGIVQCIDAGGIVARYKVEDSWKGMPDGTKFTLRIPPDPQGDQFPVSLCGQRFLVTAFKRSPRVNFISFSSGGWSPLWKRNIPEEFVLPMFEGRARLEGESFIWDQFHTKLKSVSIFKSWALDFLRLPEDERERRHLIDETTSVYSTYIDSNKQSVEAVRGKLESLRTLSGVVDEILRLYGAAADKMKAAHLIRTLSQAGGRMTLGVLHRVKAETHKLDPNLVSAITDALSKKLTPENKPPSDEARQAPTADELRIARELVKKIPWGYQAPEAFRMLAIYEPETAANALLSWQSADGRFQDEGYVLGSLFCLLCNQNREKYFTVLLDAKDDFVRVAAAVYLRHESPTLAKQKLNEFMSIKGDAGVWAALVLANNGEKAAVPRALEVFLTPSADIVPPRSHFVWGQRIKVLLSNTAAHSGIAPPAFKLTETEEYYYMGKTAFFEPCMEWWKMNQARLELYDPWLVDLDKQKVD